MQRGDELHLRGNLVSRELVAAEQPHPRLERREVFLARQRHRRDDHLAGERIRFAVHRHVVDVVEREQRVLDFHREHLVAADVDHLGVPADDANPFAVELHEVAGVEEAVRVERARRVQVAEHRRLRADIQPAVDDLGLESFAAHAHPQRSRLTRLRSQDAQLAEAVRLQEVRLRKRRADPRQRELPQGRVHAVSPSLR